MKTPPPSSEDREALLGLVRLSNAVGTDETLVQPGGGNSSIKLSAADGGEQRLFVKGSGTDMRTITAQGFTELSMPRLAGLRDRADMADEQMMAFMRECMVKAGDPVPSVETPLHSILPYRVIVHTHDIATMSITNLRDERAEELVRELFEGRIVYTPYARPGFPLALSALELAPTIPDDARGMTLAHHGLVVWGDDVAACEGALQDAVGRVAGYLEAERRGRRMLGTVRARQRAAAERRRLAEQLLPVVRGALGRDERVVLHFDDAPELLDPLGRERAAEVFARGVSTPEHILRAGRRALWLELDLAAAPEALEAAAGAALAEARREYEDYHARHAAPGEAPIADWAKVVLAPGLGMITAFKDKKSARVANTCMRASMKSMENAEQIGGFEFIPEAQVFEFEHWPLERRKVEETIAKERKEKLVPRQIALVIGGGSGIGLAAARRFAEEGAHVVVADLDGEAAARAAGELGERFPDRVIGAAADVCDEASLDALFSRCVLEYGGLDTLFYSAGLAPAFAEIERVSRADLQRQLDVHYVGAVLAIQRAARIMRRQGLGGAIVCNVSKAALAPGREAVGYGASKAALLQAIRVAMLELGPLGIRVNAINADQIDTPLFRRFVEERAKSRGVSFDEQVESYRQRNALGVSLIPPEAVAELAVLLASDRLRYTTGDVLTIDGGLPDALPR